MSALTSEQESLYNLYDDTIRNILNRLEEDAKQITVLKKEIEQMKLSIKQFGGFVMNQIEQVKGDNGQQKEK